MSKRIFWAGDSTVKHNQLATYPQTGIGQCLGLFLEKDIVIVNHAENGRSTKSFIDESRLATIYNEIGEGDFLFIQFGHNDSKKEDPSRFTKAYGDYQLNLEKFINVARNKKAYPVLITSLCRRKFLDNGQVDHHNHRDYPDAMIELAEVLDVPYIDLFDSSMTFMEKHGDQGTKRFFMNFGPNLYKNYPGGLEDNTHLRYEGAVAFAELIADGLRTIGGVYGELLEMKAPPHLY